MRPTTARPLSGFRVLVAEDNLLVAELLELVLAGLGCAVIGPARDLAETLQAIDANELDGAVLDVQLGDQYVFPAAHQLALRGVPFILSTALTDLGALPAPLANAPRLTKPFDVRELERVMTSSFLRNRRS
jgi:DNA-binding response OmpR family regulator